MVLHTLLTNLEVLLVLVLVNSDAQLPLDVRHLRQTALDRGQLLSQKHVSQQYNSTAELTAQPQEARGITYLCTHRDTTASGERQVNGDVIPSITRAFVLHFEKAPTPIPTTTTTAAAVTGRRSPLNESIAIGQTVHHRCKTTVHQVTITYLV